MAMLLRLYLLMGYAIAKANPNAKLKIYKGMGHCVPSALYKDISQVIFEHIRTC